MYIYIYNIWKYMCKIDLYILCMHMYALYKAMFLRGQAMWRTNGSMLQVGSLAWSCKAPGLHTPSLYKAWQGLTLDKSWQGLTRLDKAWQVESDSEWQKSTVKALNLLWGVHSERKSFSREKSTQRPNSTRNSHVTSCDRMRASQKRPCNENENENENET